MIIEKINSSCFPFTPEITINQAYFLQMDKPSAAAASDYRSSRAPAIREPGPGFEPSVVVILIVRRASSDRIASNVPINRHQCLPSSPYTGSSDLGRKNIKMPLAEKKHPVFRCSSNRSNLLLRLRWTAGHCAAVGSE